MDDQQWLKPSEWKKRRRILYLSLIFICVSLIYIIFKGTDSVLYQQISIALIGAGTLIIGQYIFGAIWDDKNYMQTAEMMARHNRFGEMNNMNTNSVWPMPQPNNDGPHMPPPMGD